MAQVVSGGALSAPRMEWLGLSLPELACFGAFWAIQVRHSPLFDTARVCRFDVCLRIQQCRQRHALATGAGLNCLHQVLRMHMCGGHVWRAHVRDMQHTAQFALHLL